MEFLDPRATWSRKQVRSLGGPQSPFCLSKMLQIHAAGQKGVPTTLNHRGAPFDRARSHLVQSQSWGERRSRWRQARFSRLVRKPQSSPPAKGFPQLLLRGGSEEMRLTGWEGCSQLRGTASGISIRNWRRPRAAELSLGLPRSRGCGLSPSVTIREEPAAMQQVPEKPGHIIPKREAG